jgi:hypothetical protein
MSHAGNQELGGGISMGVTETNPVPPPELAPVTDRVHPIGIPHYDLTATKRKKCIDRLIPLVRPLIGDYLNGSRGYLQLLQTSKTVAKKLGYREECVGGAISAIKNELGRR